VLFVRIGALRSYVCLMLAYYHGWRRLTYIGMGMFMGKRGFCSDPTSETKRSDNVCGEHGIFGRPWKLIRLGDLAFL
jgi:hypothetical protein